MTSPVYVWGGGGRVSLVSSAVAGSVVFVMEVDLFRLSN